MSLIKEGHNVQVHYKGTLADGTEFDNSKDRGAPLEFEVGSGQLIKGFDEAVRGMGLGEVKTFTLAPADAYGYHDPEAVQEYPKEAFPKNYAFVNGDAVEGTSQEGVPLVAKIVSSNKNTVTLDLNHPLAGKDLTFEIEVLGYGDDLLEDMTMEEAGTLEDYLENPQILEDEE